MQLSPTLLLGVLSTLFLPTLSANILSLNLSRNPTEDHPNISSRSISQQLARYGNLYTAEIEVGTPPQIMRLKIGTGDTDTWVLGKSTGNACEAEPYDCLENSIFNPKLSRTYQEISPDGFEALYSDGGNVSGGFFEDTFTIGGVEVPSLQMGLAMESTHTHEGILGLGYDIWEQNYPGRYYSFINKLVSEKLINSPVYSLWLDNANLNTGAILFGGIDTEKFVGDLLSMSVEEVHEGKHQAGMYYGFLVHLSSFGLSGGELSPVDIEVIIDSASPFIVLPREALDPIVEGYDDIWWDDNDGHYLANCSLVHSKDELEFQFAASRDLEGTTIWKSGGPSIRVPLADVILDINSLTRANTWSDKCRLGLMPSKDAGYFLGEIFLRSAYAVFDLKNNKIGLAQAYSNSTTSSVVEIEADSKGIPLLCGRNSSLCSSSAMPDESNNSKNSEHGSWPRFGMVLALFLFGCLTPLGISYFRRRKAYRLVASDEDGDLDGEESIPLVDFLGEE